MPRRVALLILVALAVLALLPGATAAAYHCDEVNVFRHVTNFARGHFAEPGRPGLLWLVLAPVVALLSPEAAIHALRGTAVLASAGTVLGVAWLAGRRDAGGAWSAVAAAGLLLTSLGWYTHAFEVRTDTYTAPLTLAAAALLLRDRVSVRAAVGAGLLVGAAGLVSQKSIYNGVGLGIAWLAWAALSRGADGTTKLRTAGAAALAAGGFLGLWYLGMGAVSGSGSFVSDNLSTAVATGFSEVWSFEKNAKTLGATAERAPLLWGLAPLGLFWALTKPRERAVPLAVALIGATMVATIVVHRGFRPYFVASFEPYLAVPAGAILGALARAAHTRLGRPGAAVGALLLAVAFGGTLHHNKDGMSALLATDNGPQLDVVRAAVEAFPDPVPYWDSIGIVPGYPETTFFGTGPTRTAKRRKTPGNLFVRLARAEKPRFFVRDYMTRDAYLKPDERRWVWRHYLPYRDNLYLLGGRIAVAPGTPVGTMEVLVPGAYTVVFRGPWEGTATVNGAAVQDGDVVTLEGMQAELAATVSEGAGDLALYLGAGREPNPRVTDWSMYPRLRRDRFQQYDRRGKPADLLTPRTDPTMTPKKHAARATRHERNRAKRRKELASP